MTHFITKKVSTADIKQVVLKKGMQTLKDNALVKVRKGETTLEELFRITGDI